MSEEICFLDYQVNFDNVNYEVFVVVNTVIEAIVDTGLSANDETVKTT